MHVWFAGFRRISCCREMKTHTAGITSHKPAEEGKSSHRRQRKEKERLHSFSSSTPPKLKSQSSLQTIKSDVTMETAGREEGGGRRREGGIEGETARRRDSSLTERERERERMRKGGDRWRTDAPMERWEAQTWSTLSRLISEKAVYSWEKHTAAPHVCSRTAVRTERSRPAHRSGDVLQQVTGEVISDTASVSTGHECSLFDSRTVRREPHHLATVHPINPSYRHKT